MTQEAKHTPTPLERAMARLFDELAEHDRALFEEMDAEEARAAIAKAEGK